MIPVSIYIYIHIQQAEACATGVACQSFFESFLGGPKLGTGDHIRALLRYLGSFRTCYLRTLMCCLSCKQKLKDHDSGRHGGRGSLAESRCRRGPRDHELAMQA